MNIILERHRYAPELNCAFIGPRKTRVAAPGCTSIREVREKLFRPLASRGRHAVLSTVYPESHSWLNRTHGGMIPNNQHLLGAIKQLRARLAPNLGAFVQVKLRLIG